MREPYDADLPVTRIVPSPHQAREQYDPDSLGALADSIAAEGLHQRIGVRECDADREYEIVWGHRRWLAFKLLQRATIPARVFDVAYDPLDAGASENLNREQLNPVEEARLVRTFLDRGLPRVEIARRCRRSVAWVSQRAELLTLPADVLDAIRHHGLSLAVAAQLADVDHEPYRKELLVEAARTGTTAAVAAVWRQHYLADRERIVHNVLAIEEVIAERGKYVVKYPCDWCEQETAYEGTRTFRLCVPCARQLVAAKATTCTAG